MRPARDFLQPQVIVEFSRLQQAPERTAALLLAMRWCARHSMKLPMFVLLSRITRFSKRWTMDSRQAARFKAGEGRLGSQDRKSWPWPAVQRAHGRRRPDRLRPRLQDGTRRHRVETKGLGLSFGALARLAQDEEPGSTGGEARGRRGLGAGTMKLARNTKKTVPSPDVQSIRGIPKALGPHSSRSSEILEGLDCESPWRALVPQG